jgi:hypothetical protein
MTKPSAPARKSRTHFEQVPLDVVKKIAEADVSKDKKPRNMPARSPGKTRR